MLSVRNWLKEIELPLHFSPLDEEAFAMAFEDSKEGQSRFPSFMAGMVLRRLNYELSLTDFTQFNFLSNSVFSIAIQNEILGSLSPWDRDKIWKDTTITVSGNSVGYPEFHGGDYKNVLGENIVCSLIYIPKLNFGMRDFLKNNVASRFGKNVTPLSLSVAYFD